MTNSELRKAVMELSENRSIISLQIFACSKILDRDLRPKGSWELVIAAIKNAGMVSKLEKVGNPFNQSKLADRKYCDRVKDVVEGLRGMSFHDFLSKLFPEYIPNCEYLASALAYCQFRNSEYEVLAVIQALLECRQEENNLYFKGSYKARTKAKEIVSAKMDWETFKLCVTSYPLTYRQVVSGPAHTVAEVFRKYQIPFRFRCGLFCGIYNALNSPKTAGKNQPLVVGSSLFNEKGVNLWNVQKAIQDSQKDIAKITVPTDCLKELWTKNPQADDSSIAVDFFLRQVGVDAHFFSPLLVINPSPDFLEQASTYSRFSKMTFAMPFSDTLPLLQRQFPKARFISFEDLANEAALGTTRYAYACLFCLELKKEALESLMTHTHRLLKEGGVFLAELPSKIATYKNTSEMSILHRAFCLKKIYTFGSGTFKAAPKKRVLIRSVKGEMADTVSISQYNICYCGHTRFLVKDKRMQGRILHIELMTDKPINKLLRDVIRNPTKHRLPAKEVKFLPEISLWYNRHKDSRHPGLFRVKGYVCAIPTEKQKRRNIYSRGKKFAESEVVQESLEESHIEIWCHTELPYKPKIQAGIRKAIDEAIRSKLLTAASLRTLWYISANFEDNWLESKEGLQEFELFSSEIGTLTGQEEKAIFIDSVNSAIGDVPFKRKLFVWKAIQSACEIGVRLGLISSNPATTALNTLRYIDSDEEYDEVRQVLSKRSFTRNEDRELLKFLLNEILANPEYLAVLIRFFTGLQPSVVAALKWKDIKIIPYSANAFHFLVRRDCNEDGSPKKFSFVEQFRQVPITPLLKRELDKRYDSILASGKISEDALADMPIMATDKQLFGGEKLFIKPGNVRNLSNKAISVLQATDVVVTLHDNKGGKEKKNLTRYSGDIFRSNFRTKVMFEAGFLEREVIYLFGLRQKNTYARHYCDYTNSLLQSYLHAKLSRWEYALQYEAKIPVTRQQIALKSVAEFSVSGFETAEFEMSFGSLSGNREKVIVDVENQNGVDLKAIMIVRNKATPSVPTPPDKGNHTDGNDEFHCASLPEPLGLES